jgi:Mn2+/Fe2+ NRAMP family transporter
MSLFSVDLIWDRFVAALCQHHQYRSRYRRYGRRGQPAGRRSDPGLLRSFRNAISSAASLCSLQSFLIAYFIILTVAVTLNAHGKTDIATAAQAAEALRPVAGAFASLLFSLGVVGTGLLAVPVLGASAAYAVGEAFRWPVGLERKAKEAKAFYSLLAIATLIGLALNFAGVDPIRALVWSAMINGVTAAPVMVFMMLMASNQKVMGKLTLPTYLKILGWAATLIMALAAIGMLLTAGS